MKLGEALLIIVTAFLVVATWEIVLGAKDSAQRELRAYISNEPFGAKMGNGRLAYYEKNFGKILPKM